MKAIMCVTKEMMHGKMNQDAHVLARQGVSKFMNMPTGMPHNNPLTAKGRHIMNVMQEQYGEKKGKQVFYASLNKKNKGTSAWHK